MRSFPSIQHGSAFALAFALALAAPHRAAAQTATSTPAAAPSTDPARAPDPLSSLETHGLLVIDVGAAPAQVYVEALHAPANEAATFQGRCAPTCTFRLPIGRALLFRDGADGRELINVVTVRTGTARLALAERPAPLRLRTSATPFTALRADERAAHGRGEVPADTASRRAAGGLLIATGSALVMVSMVTLLVSVTRRAEWLGCAALATSTYAALDTAVTGDGVRCGTQPGDGEGIAALVSGVTGLVMIPAGALLMRTPRAPRTPPPRVGLSVGPTHFGASLAFSF